MQPSELVANCVCSDVIVPLGGEVLKSSEVENPEIRRKLD